jgi:peptidylprolyl isomerase
VLLAGLLCGCGGEGGDKPAASTPAPFGWNLDQVPSAGTPLRTLEGEQGLVMHVMEEGEGEPLPPEQPMDLQYRVYMLNGRLIETSTLRAFVVASQREGGSIQGFVQGLEGIRMMERRRIYVPAVLGYGAQGKPPIPPNARLVFDVRPVRLIREDLVEGDGEVVREGHTITAHYEGRLEDGTIFQSSYVDGPPVTMPLSGFIPGWILGVPGMRVGGKRKLWIPYHLAYDGSARTGIPAYSNLTFTVEILGVK